MCDVTPQFRSCTNTVLYHTENRHPSAMSEEGSELKIAVLLDGGRKFVGGNILPVTVAKCEGFKELVWYQESKYIIT